jgi:cystathionine beta-lyase/cystathionine gamma-synthase
MPLTTLRDMHFRGYEHLSSVLALPLSSGMISISTAFAKLDQKGKYLTASKSALSSTISFRNSISPQSTERLACYCGLLHILSSAHRHLNPRVAA